MKTLLKIFFLFSLFIAVPAFSQDNASTKEEKKNDVESSRSKRRKAKAAWKERRKQDRADRKAVRKHEKALQTKATRRRMRKDRRKANLRNQNKKEFILIRIFKPKPKTGGW